MAITSYSELQTAIQNWIARDDSDIQSRAPELIALFEARFKRKIEHWRSEKRATVSTTASDAYITLPTDFLKIRSVAITSTNPYDELEYMTPQNLQSIYASTDTGQPKVFTIIGGELRFGPIPDAAYTIQMIYQAFAVLSASNTTNWLLTNYPDIYLYGSLVQAEAYLVNDERIPLWKALLDESLMELDKENKRSVYGKAPTIFSDVTKT